jgi:LPPG:FO 2-phospho-L-lactate transferase
LLKPEELSVIVNTGEDVEVSGLHVSPDLDTVVYTLAGVINEETWYGIRGDTFSYHEALKRVGHVELLRIGDRDRATKLYRTLMLRQGKPLSAITKYLCERFGVRADVMPMSDERVQTLVNTEVGIMQFHEFWVVRRAKDRVRGIKFEGAEKAKPAPGVLEALEKSEVIIIGPSNPVTSVGPILAVKEIREALERSREKVIAISPIVGNAPVSGPAGVLMEGLGYEVNPLGVARIYQEVASAMFIDRRDEKLAGPIEELGIRVVPADLLIPDLPSRVRLAREVLSLAGPVIAGVS